MTGMKETGRGGTPGRPQTPEQSPHHQESTPVISRAIPGIEQRIRDLATGHGYITPHLAADWLPTDFDTSEETIRQMVTAGLLQMVYQSSRVREDGRAVHRYNARTPRAGWTPPNEICPQCLAESTGHALQPACLAWHHRGTEPDGTVMPPPANAEYRRQDVGPSVQTDICPGCRGDGSVRPVGAQPPSQPWRRPEPRSDLSLAALYEMVLRWEEEANAANTPADRPTTQTARARRRSPGGGTRPAGRPSGQTAPGGPPASSERAAGGPS